MSDKQKLTLSVDRELVEKAKTLGVNISEIAETALRHISETQPEKIVTKEQVDTGYKNLFDAMLPYLNQFGASIDVGVIYDNPDESSGNYSIITLMPNGELYSADFDRTVKFESIDFSHANEILSKFIDKLIEASERNKEKLKELEIARRFIEALTDISTQKLTSTSFVKKSEAKTLTSESFIKKIETSSGISAPREGGNG